MKYPRFRRARIDVDDPATWEPANAADYEFDASPMSGSASLPSGWSWLNQGTSTYEEKFGAGKIRPEITANPSGEIRGIERALPASTWVATFKLATLLGSNLNGEGVLVFLRDSSSGHLGGMRFYKDADHGMMIDTVHWNDTSGSAGANWAAVGGHTAGAPVTYLRIRRNSPTSYDFQASGDGICWVDVDMARDVTGVVATPDKIGFAAVIAQATFQFELACHWFRVR